MPPEQNNGSRSIFKDFDKSLYHIQILIETNKSDGSVFWLQEHEHGADELLKSVKSFGKSRIRIHVSLIHTSKKSPASKDPALSIGMLKRIVLPTASENTSNLKKRGKERRTGSIYRDDETMVLVLKRTEFHSSSAQFG